MPILSWYRNPGLQEGERSRMFEKLTRVVEKWSDVDVRLKSIDTELCFYIVVDGSEFASVLTKEQERQLKWILSVPFEEGNLTDQSNLSESYENIKVLEIGPRLTMVTPFSTNAVSMCHSVGLKVIKRIEYSTRYLFHFEDRKNPEVDISAEAFDTMRDRLQQEIMDNMTQDKYAMPADTFDIDLFKSKPAKPYQVDIMKEGKAALQKVNVDMGLAMDDWDLDYYTDLFQLKVRRNPTNVECFDLAQSNSEHSRHWFFKGRMKIDGVEMPKSLFELVMSTQQHTNPNSVIKFSDNSSAIEGYEIQALYPEKPHEPSHFTESETKRHIIFTAETHNFPTGVAPFPGATTGTGGRIRDVQATGRGAHVIAGTAGYCFGNLDMPDYVQPWELKKPTTTPPGVASAMQICIEASNGASDYGNKFGEPVLAGFARSFSQVFPDGPRSYAKPIMFSGGIGSMESIHVKKDAPQLGMEVTKIGGPVYRIGVGGGAASSIHVQGDNDTKRDLNAVQRGDPEMEQKLNRIIRACIEKKEDNPIRSIHDQGAGGNGNVLKEISEPAGAEIRVRDFELADPTLGVLEIWGAEYQESNAALVNTEDKPLLREISKREKCPVSFVGTISDDGKIVLVEGKAQDENEPPSKKKNKKQHPVDLDLELVLGSMPQKVFELKEEKIHTAALNLPDDLTIKDALARVLRLPSVASKRYLTNKVDRSVTGLVAQQQCVGPVHTPLADVAVVALSMVGPNHGAATAVGEQPIKGLVDPAAGARMSVAEALTNLVFAQISDLKDVKCSGNWMWAAKLPGEGARLYSACVAMCELMSKLGVAVDGGKDSLSMATRNHDGEIIKAPGTLVISAYVGCPDITATVTPDLKCIGDTGVLIHIPLCSGEKYRMGGSALGQVYEQIGDVSPDLEDPELFVRAFNAMQKAIKGRLLLAGHDVSDGGFITCILEMAFAGNCGLDLDIAAEKASSIEGLFNEELGWVIEVSPDNKEAVLAIFKDADVPCHVIGQCKGSGNTAKVSVRYNGSVVLEELMVDLRDMWEETSTRLEMLQANPLCVEQERKALRDQKTPPYHLTFTPCMTDRKNLTFRPKVAVIREEGSNGDREMVAAFHMAGFEAWDVTMQDLCTGKTSLQQFQGVAFVGGFSYADVMGSAKGWAATLRYNSNVQAQFAGFYQRQDTFSLGVCNGCQLMALLGWVAPDHDGTILQDSLSDGVYSQGVHLSHNVSGRFESRFSTVTIRDSPAVMLRGMAGSTMGIWVAHGEGRMVFKQPSILKRVIDNKLAPIRYVNDAGAPTNDYPFNPNGSPLGLAALCSPDGRHLALMPHPERCVLPWQWAWQPEDWKQRDASPWMKLFQNAYDWCVETQKVC